MRTSTTAPRGLRAALIAGGLALVLTTAACGSDAGTGASSGGSTPAGSTTSSGATSSSGTSSSATSSSADSSSTGSDSSSSSSTGSDGSSSSSTGSSGDATTSSGSSAAGIDPADVSAAKATLVDPTKLTVCTTLPFEPFESEKDGEVVGFDIDLMDLVSKALGVETNVIDTPFEGIKSGEANNTGKCDISAAGMSITDERQKVMNFSDPYFNANFYLVVPSASGVTSLEGLKGMKIGGQTSTTGLDYLNENKDKFGYEVVEYTGFDLQSQAILTGQVDAVFNDVPVLKKLVDDNASTVKIAAEVDTGDQYGFGMKKGNDSLTAVTNGVLSASKSDGSYNDIYKKWFGTDAPTN